MDNLIPKYTFDFDKAAQTLAGVVVKTPLQYNRNLSQRYNCNVYLKREDLQVVRSYKLRGAYNMMSSLTPEQLQRGVVCASTGNHAQGFAYSCRVLSVKGVVFMPVITPGQKTTRPACLERAPLRSSSPVIRLMIALRRQGPTLKSMV